MIQEIKKNILKMQYKRKILKTFEKAVQETIADCNKKSIADNFTLSIMIKAAVVNTCQYLKKGVVSDFETEYETDSLIDEAARETMNKYFKIW